MHEDDLSPETLGKYSGLILPNVAFLSNDQCRQLEAYVGSGGSLLATFETSLYDERGRPRGDFGLGKLFGITKAADRQGSRGFENSFYARIEQRHEILRGWEQTNWIAGAEWRVPIRAAGKPVMTVVPPYPAYPTEVTYATTPHTEEPAIVLRERGSSRLVYLPGDAGRTYWRSGHPDVGGLLQNAVTWMLRGRRPVHVDGEGVAEIFAWETEAGFAVHLLNYNNPNLHRGYLRRHYPIGPQTVRFELPGAASISGVRLLRAGSSVPFQQEGRVVQFIVPRVPDYEVAALEGGL